MTDETKSTGSDDSFIPREHLEEIGRIANAWGFLEFAIDKATWDLCEGPHEFVACVTAQVLSAQGKIKALISLAGVRGISEGLLKELRTFNGARVGGLQERRNRSVHDTRFRAPDGSVARLQITAQSTLTFGMQPEPFEELQTTRRRIEEAIHQFLAIRDRMMAELPPLRETPPRQFVQIETIPKDSEGPPD